MAGDFKLNLIKYTQVRGVHQFLEIFFWNNFISQITLLTRVTEKSATLHNFFVRKWVSKNPKPWRLPQLQNCFLP